jgi:hypothetical protein
MSTLKFFYLYGMTEQRGPKLPLFPGFGIIKISGKLLGQGISPSQGSTYTGQRRE